MTNSTIEKSLHELNTFILSGKAMEGFEKFYANDVIMQENENSPTIGKKNNRKREIQFFSDILEFREAKILNLAVGKDISFVTWHFDYTHREWGVRNYTQVSVQTWKDGTIIKEQFFYGN